MRISFISLFCVFIFLVQPAIVWAQDINRLESDLKSSGGYERLAILQRLTVEYTKLKDRRATKYGKQAVTLGENLFSNNLEDPRWVRSYLLLGKAFYAREK